MHIYPEILPEIIRMVSKYDMIRELAGKVRTLQGHSPKDFFSLRHGASLTENNKNMICTLVIPENRKLKTENYPLITS
jgi:hypothetical protein